MLDSRIIHSPSRPGLVENLHPSLGWRGLVPAGYDLRYSVRFAGRAVDALQLWRLEADGDGTDVLLRVPQISVTASVYISVVWTSFNNVASEAHHVYAIGLSVLRASCSRVALTKNHLR